MLGNRFGADRSGQSNLTGFHHFHEDPAENLVNSLGSETVTEVIADGILGCHCINLEAGCYTYRTVTWLESELSRARLVEILDRCIEDAVKGYINLLS